MPWTRAKKLAADVRADPMRLEKELALFNACFRIQEEACAAAGRHIPLIIENVRGAIPWVGRSRWNWGPFHFWGEDIPALMPTFDRKGKGFKGFKKDWRNCEASRSHSSKSAFRKQWSAEIAKIPPEIGTWIARCFKPISSAA